MIGPLQAQFYNGTKMNFGKNRVQYDDFEWQYYRFERFETYFYTGGKELAVHAANYTNKRLGELEKLLDFYFDDRIQFVIYNKQSHFRQSNIGLSDDISNNIGGVTQIVGSKLFIYFEGDYAKFEQQIDAGLLEVLIYQMIYGGNWREVIRNSTLLTLPEWYVKGLISFLTNPDDPEINAKIKDGVLSGKFERFNALNEKEAIIAGHAMWQYIATSYGKNVVSNILYSTRMSRKVDDGFLYSIGVSFAELYDEWIQYYLGEYQNDKVKGYVDAGEKLELKTRKNRRYQNFSSSFDGRYLAYSTNKLGQYKIYIYDTETKKRNKVFQDEHKLERIQDYTYPILEWHPSGKLLTFITEDKGDVLLHTYNVESAELSRKPIFKIEKVLSYDYLKDGKQFVFSGVNEGQSDLFLYNVLGNTQKKLTNDAYDDLTPIVSPLGDKIYFVSNRINDSLGIPHEENSFLHETDIFVYDFNKKEDKISSVTDTDYKNEVSPIWLDGKLHYLIQERDHSAQFEAEYDSAVSKIDTIVHYNYYFKTLETAKYNSPIISQSGDASSNLYQSTIKDKRYAFYKKDLLEEDTMASSANPTDPSGANVLSPLQEESFTVIAPSSVQKEVNIYDYQFNNATKIKSKPTQKKQAVQADDEVKELKFPTQRIYKKNFKVNRSLLQLNNVTSSLNNQYQIFNGGPYINSGVGIYSGVEIVDLMEDHRIYGGIRYSGELIEYLLSYKNLEKQLDKEFVAYRSKERVSGVINPFDIRTLSGTMNLSYPFSEVTSLRGGLSVRNDKVIPLSTSRVALETDIFNEYWASSKVEYVFDNTREIATNIRYGTKFKIFAEHYRMVYSEQESSPSSDLSVVGFDFRHYQKIHRELIFVGRFAGSRSFGKTPLIYYLGGVDEVWGSDLFDRSTPIDFSQNYGFQALAANLRGFQQNIRNGNNFVLINTELRFPVFSYFINRPIQSEMIKNFQLIGFGDIGTAWTGNNPYADDNPLNNETLTNGPITVTYENINDPIVGGVGFGLRSTIFGYFVRTDWAWGIENGEISKETEFTLSLTLDI